MPLSSYRIHRDFSPLLLIIVLLLLTGCNLEHYRDIGSIESKPLSDHHIALLERHNTLRTAERDGTIDEHGTFFSVDTISGIFQYEGTTLYITVFGSDDTSDIFNVTLHVLRDIPLEGASAEVKAHSGYYESYLTIKPFVHEEIEKQIQNGLTDVVSAGHSMGAAIATLCAFELTYTHPSLTVSCFPSGSPRVGNKAFTAAFNERVPDCHRVVNGDDPVPTMPTKGMGFRHVGEYHHIGPGPSPLRAAFGFGIADHFISSYVASIEAGLY